MTNKKGLLARLAAAALALTVALAGAAPAVALAEDEETYEEYVPKYEIKGKTLKVNKKSAKAGQKVKISVKVTGKPKYVYAQVKRVLSNPYAATQTKDVRLKRKSGNTYVGTITVTNAWAKGTWRVDCIRCYGGSKTNQKDYNSAWWSKESKWSELKTAKFKVKGTTGDKTGPVVDTAKTKVSKKKVNVTKKDQKIKVTLKASDAMSKLGDSAYVGFVKRDKKGNYQDEIWGNLKKSGKGYKGTLTAYQGQEKGTYKLEYITVHDDFGNGTIIHAKSTKKFDKKNLKSTLKYYKQDYKNGWYGSKKAYKQDVKATKARYKKIKYVNLKKFKIVVK